MEKLKEEVKEKLHKLSDEKYKKFHTVLCPGVDNILGVRVPILRNYAKELKKEYNLEDLIQNIDDQYYEEIMLKGMIIGLEKKKDFDIYSDAASVCWNNASPNKYRSYRINVRRFCLIVSRIVKSYYEDNKDKFDFMNCNVIDWDAVTEKMYRLSHPYEEV